MPLSKRVDAKASSDRASADDARARRASEGARIWRLIEETACVDGFKRCRMETMLDLVARVTALRPKAPLSSALLSNAFVSRPLIAKERQANEPL